MIQFLACGAAKGYHSRRAAEYAEARRETQVFDKAFQAPFIVQAAS